MANPVKAQDGWTVGREEAREEVSGGGGRRGNELEEEGWEPCVQAGHRQVRDWAGFGKGCGVRVRVLAGAAGRTAVPGRGSR